jgi:CNT family concentrative nucleoside transporter
MPPIVASLIGILVILAIAFLLSVGKRRIRLR